MRGRRRVGWRVVVVAAAMMLAAVVSGPAGATPIPVQDDDEAFDANETQSTIERVRLQLLAVAGVTGVLLVVYIWHTDPQRRLRVATRRRDERERAAIEALDDEFLLPVDVDPEPGGTDDNVDEPAGGVEADQGQDDAGD